MARGGFRPGAGRPRKSGPGKAVDAACVAVNAAAPEAASVEVHAGQVTPLEYLLRLVNDATASAGDRFKAAVAAAPYIHARAGDTLKGKKEQAQEAAEKAATGKFAPRTGPRLVKG